MFSISGQSPDSSIRPEPSFVGTSLKNITVPEGRDVVLSCTVKNLDGHKVAWIHYDRSAILTVDKTVITRNARIGVSHESSRTWNLHIRDVQRSDAGAYMCQINTAKAKTRMGHLTVVGKFILILIQILDSVLPTLWKLKYLLLSTSWRHFDPINIRSKLHSFRVGKTDDWCW